MYRIGEVASLARVSIRLLRHYDDIGLMNAPDFDRHAGLLQQRALLARRAGDLAQLLALLDRTLAELELTEEQKMSKEAMFEVFPELDREHIAEAEQRWGQTGPWQESARRAAHYTKADWERLKQEQQQVNEELATVFKAGKAADSPEAVAAAEAARLLIERWHYACSRDFHVNLTAMTSSDERFVRNIDRACPGLAAFIHEAAKANLALNG